LSDTTTLRIWLNNTPPKVTIQRSHENYSLEDTTVVHLVASAIDNEQANLTYTWEVFLHHSDHNHPEPLVMDSVITFTIDPLGCGEESYYYSAKLVVSDSLGLATILELFFYPDCLRPRGLTADELTSTVSLAWEKSVTNVDAYLVLASTKDNITFNPAELETVETSSDYTDAPVLTDSSRVVYFGADTCAEVTHLRNFTKYHFFVFGKKDAAWSEASHVEATPKVFAPRIQSRDIVMNALDSISIEFSFSRGDGTFAAAFVTSDSLFAPKDFHYYTINKGDNFHIEVTAADSATMSGLKPLTSYFLKIFEFNEADSIPIYLTTQESNSISFRTDQVITSTEPGILKGPDISIYPVPVNTHIYIHWNDGKKDAGIEGRIFNMQGQLADEFLFTTTSHNGIYSRNIKNIPPGLFILQLRSDLLVRTFKIFKN
jgi:hypothetical protein